MLQWLKWSCLCGFKFQTCRQSFLLIIVISVLIVTCFMCVICTSLLQQCQMVNDYTAVVNVDDFDDDIVDCFSHVAMHHLL